MEEQNHFDLWPSRQSEFRDTQVSDTQIDLIVQFVIIGDSSSIMCPIHRILALILRFNAIEREHENAANTKLMKKNGRGGRE